MSQSIIVPTPPAIARPDRHPIPSSLMAQLADIPEKEIWLAKQKSARTHRAYRLDVRHFMATSNITTSDELRQVDHRAVIAWERHMREVEHAAPSTIRRRLSALSSLFKHLVRHSHAARNPVREIERPTINRDEGSTLAFSKAQARKLLDAPAEDAVEGLRDRAILSVGLQVGLRRAEVAALKVGDLRQNRGYDSLRVTVRAEGATRLRSIRRRRRGFVSIWSAPAMPMISMARCSGRSSTTASNATPGARWTRTRSTACCGNMLRCWPCRGGIRRIRCARPSSPRRWKTARSLRTCRRRRATATRARLSSTTAAGTTPRKPPASLPPISRNDMRKVTVFYAWQSDTPQRFNRHLIRLALEIAARRINEDVALGVEMHIDSDTQGVPRQPPVTETILKKIAACDIFAPDLTFVARTDAGKFIPNPNVMVEYGYALRAKSHSAMLPVMNTAFGPPGSLPFDMGHLRHPTQFYVSATAKDAERRAARKSLCDKIEAALRVVLAAQIVEVKQESPFPEAPDSRPPAFFFPSGCASSSAAIFFR